jgi:hypothetical protein
MSSGNPNGRVRIPDDTIRAMRRMHEVERKTAVQVIAAFPAVSTKHVYDVLARRVRAKVVDEVAA